MKRVLVVDDDRRMRRTLQIVVESMGLASAAAASGEDAREQLRKGRFDLVLTDLKMPGASGIDLLEQVRAEHPRLPVVLITAYGTIQTAIEAMRKGASDYVLKPFDNESLRLVIGRALELERYRSENVFLREQVGESWAAEDSFLALPSMREVADRIGRVASSSSPVLLTGETGTGKELAARSIHNQSPRHRGLFVPLNCAALPGELLEAELFGHVRGAFTGAAHDRQGKFEVADGGTLFLDEIGDMPLSLQAKLLRVLEDATVEPLGTNRRISVDVRVISATNQNLKEAIAGKRFRSDLYFRLNTFEIHLCPLRERPGDIDILAPLFLGRFAREVRKGPLRLSDDALALLRRHAWPGNVRELRNLMERAAVLSPEGTVTERFFRAMIQVPESQQAEALAVAAADESRDTGAEADVLPLGEAVDRFERREILRALERTSDNKAEAARRLGISERTLWYKLRKYGL
jgi:two-component system response regulator AtoC